MPEDLARHRYIPSVIAIYRSAWRLIEGLQLTWQRIPQTLARFPLAWSHGLTAAVSHYLSNTLMFLKLTDTVFLNYRL